MNNAFQNQNDKFIEEIKTINLKILKLMEKLVKMQINWTGLG